MKVSKITVSICALLDILVGCLIANIPETYTLALNILLGVFTGLFVSIVTSLICYFHEKITIISKAKSQLPDVYIDLLIVQQMTGSILPRIIHTYRLDDLNYRTVISISDLAVHAIDKNSLKLYSPFLKYGKKAKFVRDIDQFEDKLYNLKFCLTNIQKNVLDADLLQLEKTAFIPSPMVNTYPKESLLIETRNCVNVQTAKVHEYETSLLLELDDLGFMIFGHEWEKKKSGLTTQATNILQRN